MLFEELRSTSGWRDARFVELFRAKYLLHLMKITTAFDLESRVGDIFWSALMSRGAKYIAERIINGFTFHSIFA